MTPLAELRRAYAGRRVLITGDTGFKGSWLSAWLLALDAEVMGVALPAEAGSHFLTLGLSRKVSHRDLDIRDAHALLRTVDRFGPEVVFHLAAQPLVRDSYSDPSSTFATNVQGTVHLLDAIRQTGSVRAAVIVTSDKCYENREWEWAYRENDPMGGHDPYSASKGAAELVVSSFRRSFFGTKRPKLGLATARAGNVIGGGDWSRDRLVPDCARTLLLGQTLTLRSPKAVRPWQHVLEPLGGYLTLGARLLDDPLRYSTAYNFGPQETSGLTVGELAERFRQSFKTGDIVHAPQSDGLHEATLLRLSCEKARNELGYRSLLSTAECVDWTARWYRAHRDGDTVAASLTVEQLTEYQNRMNTGRSIDD